MNLNKLYRGEIEGTTKDEEASQEEIKKLGEQYLERFEIWSNDETSKIILRKLDSEWRKLLTNIHILAITGEERELRGVAVRLGEIQRTVNLMKTGEYKL